MSHSSTHKRNIDSCLHQLHSFLNLIIHWIRSQRVKKKMILYNLVNTGQCCLLRQQRQPWARERLGVSRQDWSGPRETWGRWWDTAVPEFPPVSPRWQAACRAEAEPARRGEEEIQRTKPEAQWEGYPSERETGHHRPSSEAPERSPQRHRSPFWLEGTPAGKGISPKLQEALGLYRTVYPTNINIYSFTLNEKKLIFTQIYLHGIILFRNPFHASIV